MPVRSAIANFNDGANVWTNRRYIISEFRPDAGPPTLKAARGRKSEPPFLAATPSDYQLLIILAPLLRAWNFGLCLLTAKRLFPFRCAVCLSAPAVLPGGGGGRKKNSDRDGQTDGAWYAVSCCLPIAAIYQPSHRLTYWRDIVIISSAIFVNFSAGTVRLSGYHAGLNPLGARFVFI